MAKMLCTQITHFNVVHAPVMLLERNQYLKIVKSKAVPLHVREILGGEEEQLLLILDFATRWCEWLTSCPGWALPPGKGPQYPLTRRLGGPQSQSGCRG
jgi:hypothetical protein